MSGVGERRVNVVKSQLRILVNDLLGGQALGEAVEDDSDVDSSASHARFAPADAWINADPLKQFIERCPIRLHTRANQVAMNPSKENMWRSHMENWQRLSAVIGRLLACPRRREPDDRFLPSAVAQSLVLFETLRLVREFRNENPQT